MFAGQLVVADYYHVNKIDWPMIGSLDAYAVGAVVVAALVAIASP